MRKTLYDLYNYCMDEHNGKFGEAIIEEYLELQAAKGGEIKTKEPFAISQTEVDNILNSLDETGGFLMKESELKYWIEFFVNKHRDK